MASATKRQLPAGFDDLEPLVDAWVLPDSQARATKRLTTSYDELQAFYDCMLPHAERVLDYLRSVPLGSMKRKQERLLKLMLALAEVGPAVEWYGQSGVIDGYDPRRFQLKVQLDDSARQVREQ